MAPSGRSVVLGGGQGQLRCCRAAAADADFSAARTSSTSLRRCESSVWFISIVRSRNPTAARNSSVALAISGSAATGAVASTTRRSMRATGSGVRPVDTRMASSSKASICTPDDDSQCVPLRPVRSVRASPNAKARENGSVCCGPERSRSIAVGSLRGRIGNHRHTQQGRRLVDRGNRDPVRAQARTA